MIEAELDLFVDMLTLYSYVGEDVTMEDETLIEVCEKLRDNKCYCGIEVLFNENGIRTAKELFQEYAGIDLDELNRLADNTKLSRSQG